MFSLKNVSVSYGKKEVLKKASVSIHPKETVCMTGSADSGKTTILSLLLRIKTPDSGIVEADDIDIQLIPKHILQLYRRKFGVKFQGGELLTARTVTENIALPLEIQGKGQEEINQKVQQLLKQFQLQKSAHFFPRDLSKSQVTLTALARALAGNPMILLLDEPLEDLDEKQSLFVLSILQKKQEEGLTLVTFSRDASLAESLNGQCIQLENGTLTEHEVASHDPMDSHHIFTKFVMPFIKDREEKEAEKKPNVKKVRITAIHSR